jgi:quinol monooxygenase YgiN
VGSAQTARADEPGDAAVYVVSYIEIVPASERAVIALLRQYRDASRKEESNVRLEVLQQSDRPDHFAILEVWKNRKGFDAHGTAVHTRQFRDKLQPISVSPLDERLHAALAVGSMPAPRAAGATYVLTHADAAGGGPARDEAIALLKQLADTSRKDDGNVGFEVLQQSSRLNHSTIVEMWKDQQAFERHRIAAYTRQFREKFHPLSGALYDERVYKSLE